jgi:hypothetical protein
VTQTAPTKTKKPLWKRWWLWVLVALVVIIAISATGGGDDAGSGSGGAVSDPAGAPAADAPAEAAQRFPGQTENDTVADGGQTITVDDVAITATPMAPGDDTIGATLCTTVTVVNGSDEQVSYNPFEFTLQDPAGAARNSTFGGSDTLLNSGELAPGGTVTGDVCFDATEQGGMHALIHEPVFSFSDERAVWVTTL